ncbi:MAG TPA: sulfotransferase [Myxococcota bacterium]|nr:sulfotransferase [Myxococcota bacterium]
MLDFLGIGAQKAGTTWLWQNLLQHPEIRFPGGKELHFWDAYYERGLGWYEAVFANEGPAKCGEITPAYALLGLQRIEALRALNPALRLLYCVREPQARCWSAALMALARCDMRPEEASDRWFIDHFLSQASRLRTDYLGTIQRWCSVFGTEALLVVRFDTLVSRPRDVLEACCRHIGVDPAFYTSAAYAPTGPVNAGPRPPLRPALQQVLRELYGEHMRSLECYLQAGFGLRAI